MNSHNSRRPISPPAPDQAARGFSRLRPRPHWPISRAVRQDFRRAACGRVGAVRGAAAPRWRGSSSRTALAPRERLRRDRCRRPPRQWPIGTRWRRPSAFSTTMATASVADIRRSLSTGCGEKSPRRRRTSSHEGLRSGKGIAGGLERPFQGKHLSCSFRCLSVRSGAAPTKRTIMPGSSPSSAESGSGALRQADQGGSL